MSPYADPEKRRSFQREYRLAHRKQLRVLHQKWREKNRERIRRYKKKYYQEHKEKALKYNRNWKKSNPEKVKAHTKALKLPLDSFCFICGSTENLERHHPDYNLPLKFATVCKSCHQFIHKKGN